MRALSLQLKPRSLELQIQERSVLLSEGESMSRKEETSEARQLKRRRRPEGKQRTYFVEESTDQYDIYAMYHLSSDRKKSFKVDLKLCGRKTRWKSTRVLWRRYLINEATYGRLRDALGPLQTRKAFLSSYRGEKIPVLAAVMASVKYESQQKK